MRAYISTEKGLNKSSSEDRVLVSNTILIETEAEIDFDYGIVAVADGVGGNNGGAVAAYHVCKALKEIAEPGNDDFVAINNSLIEKGKSNTQLHDMATTLSGIVFTEHGKCYVIHVGNTRVYSIQAAQYLKQLTEDDTVVNFLMRTGKLTEDEARSYPGKNEITACFGGGKQSLLKISCFDIDTGAHEQFLLTCDGIHDTLTIDDMEEIVADYDGDWLNTAKAMIKKAKDSGSTDDCTVVIVDTTKTSDDQVADCVLCKDDNLGMSSECTNKAIQTDVKADISESNTQHKERKGLLGLFKRN